MDGEAYVGEGQDEAQLFAKDARALRVLDAAAKLGNWQQPLPKGHGRGIAFLRGYGSVTDPSGNCLS
jgi:hypothetical protein